MAQVLRQETRTQEAALPEVEGRMLTKVALLEQSRQRWHLPMLVPAWLLAALPDPSAQVARLEPLARTEARSRALQRKRWKVSPVLAAMVMDWLIGAMMASA